MKVQAETDGRAKYHGGRAARLGGVGGVGGVGGGVEGRNKTSFSPRRKKKRGKTEHGRTEGRKDGNVTRKATWTDGWRDSGDDGGGDGGGGRVQIDIRKLCTLHARAPAVVAGGEWRVRCTVYLGGKEGRADRVSSNF